MQKNKNTFKTYSDRMSEILSSINSLEVHKLLSSIRNTMLNKGIVYVLGNGGSASTASHFVNDLAIITKRRGINVNAISLVDSVATITAIGNDESFSDIFKIQLLDKLQKKDLVFITFYFKRISKFINIFDIPNENRKIHKTKVANIGGFIFFLILILLLYFTT